MVVGATRGGWRGRHEQADARRSARTRPTSSGGRAARSRSRPRPAASRSVLALSYGERGESGELWKEPGQTVENVKEIRARRGRARRGRARRDFECLDLGDYPLEVDRTALERDRRPDPRVRAGRPPHPHRPRPVQPRSRGGVLRGRARARAGRRRRDGERVRDRSSRRSSCSSSRTSRSSATSRRRRSSTSRR